MPLVSTEKFSVPIENGNTEIRGIRINFNRNIGGFYIKIENLWVLYFTQKERHEELGIHRDNKLGFLMIDSDIENLSACFGRFIKKSIKKIRETHREKVLIIDFETEGLEEEQQPDGGVITHFTSGSMWDKYDKTRMTFSYKVGYKCGEVFFDEEMTSLSQYSIEDSFILKWTESREAFFFQIHEGFHGMITKIKDFLEQVTETPKMLDMYIETGVKLLPSVSGKKEKP